MASRPPRNLLAIPVIRRSLQSRWYPAILAYPTIIVFSYIVVTLLWGPGAAAANLGTSLTWVLWWPLLPIFLFALGRFWCAICPFGTLIDFVQKVAGLGGPVPPFLKKYGIWIIDGTFIVITWADHIWGIVESPRGSGYLLGLLVTATVVSAVFLERRAWCRYLCFLGGLSGNYARTSALTLRATPSVCAACRTLDCYRGNTKAPGCPVFEFPRTMQTSANCNLCANCIKACPNDSLRLDFRAPTRELWFLSRPAFAESFLAVVIVGIVLVQNVTMLSFWTPAMAGLKTVLFGSEPLAFTVVFLAAMTLPFALVTGAAWISSRGKKSSLNFARFGYAIVPLDLAGHVAHNLFHLLSEGRSIFYNAAGLFGLPYTGPSALLSAGALRVLQFAVLTAGIFGSVYTAWRIARNPRAATAALWPHIAVILLFSIVNLYLFTLPMSHRV